MNNEDVKNEIDGYYNFSADTTEEIQNYLKYLDFIKEGRISAGNKNWLIIDSNNDKSQKICDYLKTQNESNYTYTKIIKDVDFYEKKYGFNELKFINEINHNSTVCNILIISSLPPSVALKKYGSRCTFFLNLDNEKNDEEVKRGKICNLLMKNDFKLENDNVLDELVSYDYSDVEKALIRAFLNILSSNNNSNVIKHSDINILTTDYSNSLEKLNNLIGLKKAKETIIEIVNYLAISKRRNDMPSLNMAFLGNPRNWKNNGCKDCRRNFL